jgi:Protein of unknown function (DUF1365)
VIHIHSAFSGSFVTTPSSLGRPRVILLGSSTSVRAPFSHSDFDIALLQIRLHPHTHIGALKFSTSLRTIHIAPFRMFSVLAALATHQFILFLTLPSILYQAAVLHYRHHLDAYKRQKPKPSTDLPLCSLPNTHERWGGHWSAETYNTLVQFAIPSTVSWMGQLGA